MKYRTFVIISISFTGITKKRLKKLIPVLFVLFGHACFTQTNPSIQFTFVPVWGNTGFVQGRVQNTTPGDHGVAVYIFVEEAGGWWNKPYTSDPVTLIQPDSTFSTNIVTGGIDEFATKIIAFLIPLTFTPPSVSGGDLPNTLFSFPYVVSCRPHGDRIISWSGFDWIVKKSVGNSLLPMGPGPNIFNDNDTMAWVDNMQRLHLRIAKNGNAWHCSELICTTSQGYNRYQFDVGSRVDLLDPNIIAGIFTWDDCSPLAQPPNYNFREIDFEFSRWGNPDNDNSQFVIQPWNIPGNIDRFNMNLAGIGHSVHSFDWSSDSIVFKSTWGNSSYSWKYTNPNYIPVPGYENIRINLWLMNGFPPSDNLNAELILNSVTTNIRDMGFGKEKINIFPNPAEQGCVIDILSDRIKDLVIDIHDLHGRLIKEVYKGKSYVGSNRITWDGKDEYGKPVQPGIYLISFRDNLEIKYFKIIKI